MGNNQYVRSAMAHAALELVPQLIRRDLLDDLEFTGKFGLNGDSLLNFGDSGISIRRSLLFDAIRKVLGSSVEIKISDINGLKWRLTAKTAENAVPTLSISRYRRRLILPDFSAISPDKDTRLRALGVATADFNLPKSAQSAWYNTLTDRPLQDEEVERLHNDIRDTPVHLARQIADEIKNGESSLHSLVPLSRRYYERLIGVYDGSASVSEYASKTGNNHFKELFIWNPYEGFLLSLLLASHSTLSNEVRPALQNADLLRAYEYLQSHGDRVAQLGAIEVGFRILPDIPELESTLVNLVRQIRDDDADNHLSLFKLLSSLFVLVDGELSRARLFSEEPPFYRRLASLSQAALLARQLQKPFIDIEKFSEWAFRNRGEQYYFQTLADMRLLPRWNPDLAGPSQMKADFCGRIMIAARTYEKNIKNGELHELVLGTGPKSLHAISDFPRPYFPGPLEGDENSPNELPPELLMAIETQLNAKDVGPSSFIALVNSAMLFRLQSEYAELAAKALKDGSYQLRNLKDRDQLVAILNGLATVAAATRSAPLADQLQILVRKYRRDVEFQLNAEEALRVGLVAAASRADLNEWCRFASGWLIELAFGDLKGDEGKKLHSHLQCLLQAVPELWVTSGRADAALMAYNASMT